MISGQVKKILPNEIKLPLLGWYSVFDNKKKYIGNYYFNNWYYCCPDDEKIIKLSINLNSFSIPAMIRQNNLYCFQFHPEKSSFYGMKIIKKIFND